MVNNKKILITGGAGFIGSHCVESWHENNEILVVDNLYSGNISNLEGFKHKFIQEDISQLKAMKKIISDFSPDIIVHLAAIASVQDCIEKPQLAYDVNQVASFNILQSACENSVESFHFASSAAVYGSCPKLPKNEVNSTTLPISSYGVDKFSFEQYLIEFARRGRIRANAFRFFNVFGPRQNPSSPYSGVLSIFTDRVLNNQEPELLIFGDGEQTRDFIYVTDVVKGISQSIDSELNAEVFNLGYGSGISLLEVVKTLESLSKKKIKLHFKEARIGDIKYSYCDNKKILEHLKFSENFSTGFEKYWKDLLKT